MLKKTKGEVKDKPRERERKKICAQKTLFFFRDCAK